MTDEHRDPWGALFSLVLLVAAVAIALARAECTR